MKREFKMWKGEGIYTYRSFRKTEERGGNTF